MRDLSPGPVEYWETGGLANVSMSIIANHGGGWLYRLCPAHANLTEGCFQKGTLRFEGTTQWLIDDAGAVLASIPAIRTSLGTTPEGSLWARNPIPMFPGALKPPFASVPGRGPFHFGVVDTVRVPDVPPGNYVLSFRWDAEQTKQVWSQCGDVTIARQGATSALATTHTITAVPTAGSFMPPQGRKTSTKAVCTGGSLGLDVVDCDSWVSVYDSLGGDQWPASWRSSCDSLRTDPCGCQSTDGWGMFLRCTGKRDILRISEIYLLGPLVDGILAEEIGNMSALVALSIVESNIRGPLPDTFGQLRSLEMLWMDNNKKLGGPVPPSLNLIGHQLTVIELARSNFSGSLPYLPFASIPDCTLGGTMFACPLPPGADTACGATCL